jgi:hypothetical protein
MASGLELTPHKEGSARLHTAEENDEDEARMMVRVVYVGRVA